MYGTHPSQAVEWEGVLSEDETGRLLHGPDTAALCVAR
jgi:hypothetical protein